MASYYLEIPPPGTVNGVTNVGATSPLSSTGGTNPNISIQQASTMQDGYLSAVDFNTFNNKVTDAQVYYHYPVTMGVTENDIVMNATDPNTAVAPLVFKLAINNDTQYYPQLYGVAKNVSGGFADIYLGFGSVVSGFSFGAFIGVEYYLDPANPGKLTFTPPTGQVNVIKVGRALSATQLVLNVFSQFVQDKGALYTSDGSGYDATLLVGTNGNVLVANSSASTGQSWSPAVVASAPFTYVTSTRTLTAATATNSAAGFLSAADHTTFAAKQSTTLTNAHVYVGNVSNVATDVAMTGDVTISNTGVTSVAATTVTGKLITGFVSGAGTVAATDTILQSINKLDGNVALKAPLASPIFTGTPTLPTGTVAVTQSAGNSTTAVATTAFVTTANNLKANIASPTFTGDVNSSTGNVLISSIGKGLQVKTGANAKIGTSVLVGGTVTVANTSVTANSRIFLTSQTDGGVAGFLRVTAKTAATSFVITSSNPLDTSTVAWNIIESIP